MNQGDSAETVYAAAATGCVQARLEAGMSKASALTVGVAYSDLRFAVDARLTCACPGGKASLTRIEIRYKRMRERP